ncbi:hypothetical protein HAZT_HAZT000760 [Hyalella azteca]|uniref:Glycylpeptide N-tetradecanoyltransferase n=1 Tax=Hyalella azteca TaxID=294128 RepID=A0A6A0GZZ8_HYAAZ|nr:hypothetical protein HAZT_HAZT000760 [Hyalella azteca]
MLDVSRGTVSKIITTVFERKGKTSSAKHRSGRKSKLSERDRRFLNRIVRDNRITTAVKITVELNGHLQNPVTIKTVRRELHRSRFYGRAALENLWFQIQMLQSVKSEGTPSLKMLVDQAVYTAGVLLPQPVSSCRYWHRNLNPKKLIEVKFSHLRHNMTMQRTLKLYKLPDQPLTPGYRRVTKKDLPRCKTLLEDYLKQFQLSPLFNEEEFNHWFLPKDDIVDSYLVERGGTITDFVSFYTLPSTVMHHPVHQSVRAAYSFYNVSTETPWTALMQDALISAKNTKFDVFNALDLMENKVFLEKLKFGQGDGNLQYYMYNWRCSPMPSEKVCALLTCSTTCITGAALPWPPSRGVLAYCPS